MNIKFLNRHVCIYMKNVHLYRRHVLLLLHYYLYHYSPVISALIDFEKDWQELSCR